MAIITVALTDSFDDWRVKHNNIATEIGDLATLLTTDKIEIVSAINELQVRTVDIGVLASLDTDYQVNLVGAINEVNTNADQNTVDTATNTSDIATINSTLTAQLPYAHDVINVYGNAGSGIVFDADTYDGYDIIVNFSPLVITFTGLPVGRSFKVVMTNPGLGTITWPAEVKWPSGVEPTWTTTGVDIVEFYRVDASNIYATLVGLNYS
jgi:hypothetical protein